LSLPTTFPHTALYNTKGERGKRKERREKSEKGKGKKEKRREESEEGRVKSEDDSKRACLPFLISHFYLLFCIVLYVCVVGCF
jgi:hypothetical protein